MFRLPLVLTLLLASCGSSSKTIDGGGGVDSSDALDGPDARLPTGSANGFITYSLGSGIHRIAAAEGATPLNISTALNALSAGSDEQPAVSRNGEYLTMLTTRFESECKDWACLAVVKGDLSAGEIVQVNGQPLRPEGRAAISNTGDLIVYPSNDGPHAQDLYAVSKSGSSWGTPKLLTGDSDHAHNTIPVLSSDGSTALFNCGPVPYGQEGTGVCEVGTDGSGLKRLVAPTANGGSSQSIAHHGDYMPGGNIVFEADWKSEQIYMLPTGGGSPVRIMASQSNDNSPCSLPGGYIASLWLGRPGGNSVHELKIMAPDGSSFSILTPDIDVSDTGISCHD